MNSKTITVVLCFAALTGCASMGGGAGQQSSAPAAASTSTKVPPGMNAAGEVVDPKAVEAGHGQNVKGINDYQGEITGIPVPGSKFTQLQIGMPMRQVMD